MDELILINYSGEQPTVSARDLHTGLEVSERFQSWFNRRFGEDHLSERISDRTETTVPVVEREWLSYEKWFFKEYADTKVC